MDDTDQELLQDLADYLGMDQVDDDMVHRRLVSVLSSATAYVKGAVSQAIDLNEPRTHEMVLIVAGDLYETRSFMERSSNLTPRVRMMVQDYMLQLRLEARDGTGQADTDTDA